jgi:hypothetical protein
MTFGHDIFSFPANDDSMDECEQLWFLGVRQIYPAASDQDEESLDPLDSAHPTAVPAVEHGRHTEMARTASESGSLL